MAIVRVWIDRALGNVRRSASVERYFLPFSMTMSSSKITVTVKLFAAYQEACGVPELQLEVERGAAVGVVRDRLIGAYPQLTQWRDLTRFGINLQFVESDTPMQDGDEVVLIPPVSGGA